MNTENQYTLLDIAAVKKKTGFKSTTSVYSLMRERNLPKPITIGRTNRWIEAEVSEWINKQIQNSRGGAQS